MNPVRRVQGDINDTIDLTLSGVEDLTSAVTVEAHVWRHNVDKVTLTAAITNAVNRTVRVQLGGAAGWLKTAAEGLWWFEVQVRFADTTELTWPSGIKDLIDVRADA